MAAMMDAHELSSSRDTAPQIHDMRSAHQRVARARVRIAEREVAAEGLVSPIDLGAAVDQHTQSPGCEWMSEREKDAPKC
jgi:hypothetical protein